jgi:methionyl aminopeptidase
MTIDSDRDLEALKRIGRIVGLAVKEMARHVQPGMSTGKLDEIGRQFLQKHGARSAPRLVYNFPGDTCISINEEAAHGIPGERLIQPGDLVNIDVSAELDGYFADTAGTVQVPPSTRLQRKLCRCTQSALEKAISVARAGQLINQIGRVIEEEAHRCGFETLVELGGHGVGRSIHEEPHNIPNYYDRRDHRLLGEGQVITIEPFLTTGARLVTTGPDGWTLKTKDDGLSVQYEHTLVITRERPILITAV